VQLSVCRADDLESDHNVRYRRSVSESAAAAASPGHRWSVILPVTLMTKLLFVEIDCRNNAAHSITQSGLITVVTADRLDSDYFQTDAVSPVEDSMI